MSSLQGFNDHPFTLVVGSAVAVIAFFVLSVSWYWALISAMIVSGLLEFAIKEVPPDTDKYDSNQYRLWAAAFGDSQQRSKTSGDGTATHSNKSVEALRDRYARGELTEEQFEQKVEQLLESESSDSLDEQKNQSDALTEQGG